MSALKVRYVGKKDSETDHLYGTGIVWIGAGDVQEVPADAWLKMAKHTDVWELVESEAAQAPADGKGKGGLSDADTKKDGDVSDPALADENAKIAMTLENLDALTDAEVREFAKSLQVTLPPNLKGDNLRARVREALAA